MSRSRAARPRRRLTAELRELRARLDESEGALRALREGRLDALVASGGAAEAVRTVGGMEPAFRRLVEAMNEGAALVTASGLLLYCNRRLAGMARAPLERVMGAPLGAFVAEAARPGLAGLLRRAVREPVSGELELGGEGRPPLPVHLSLSPLEVAGEACACLVATDLSQRKRLEEELRDQSLRDELTGLSNRRGFLLLARQQLQVAKRLGRSAVLLFADLDGLKVINDTFGHAEGDRALSEAAGLLRAAFRAADVVGRLGGDEFAVLAMGDAEACPRQAARRIQRLLDAHNQRSGRAYRLSLSVGAEPLPAGAEPDLDEVLRRADGLMYAQKRARHASEAGLPA